MHTWSSKSAGKQKHDHSLCVLSFSTILSIFNWLSYTLYGDDFVQQHESQNLIKNNV